MPMNLPELQLIFAALAAICVLVVLISWLKMNPFLALLLSSLFLGASAGQPLLKALKSFEEGLGATMSGVAAVIGLGVMLGKLLENSGGAEVLARRFNEFFGPARAVWCMIALGIVIGLATWFVVIGL